MQKNKPQYVDCYFRLNYQHNSAEKNARDIPSQRKAWNLDRICETHQKNTSPCTYSSALIGGRLRHHRHTWMAVSHGQFRVRRASNIVQVIFGAAHSSSPPPFQERGRRAVILSFPFLGRRAPRDDHLLPLFRRRALRIE